MNAEHQQLIKELRKDLQNERKRHEKQIDKEREKHEQEMRDLRSEHKQEMKDLRSEHKQEMQDLRSEHKAQVEKNEQSVIQLGETIGTSLKITSVILQQQHHDNGGRVAVVGFFRWTHIYNSGMIQILNPLRLRLTCKRLATRP